MTKLFFTFLIVLISFSASAQDSVRIKEVGISFANLNSFGLTYKAGSNKSLWRFNTLFINGSQNNEIADSLERRHAGTGIIFEIGKEFRSSINENFEIRYGLDLGFQYYKSVNVRRDLRYPNRDRDDTNTSYGPSINLVFGFNYVINESLILGVEMLPNISYSKGTNIQYDPTSGKYNELEITNYSYGFSNNSARLTLAYRF